MYMPERFGRYWLHEKIGHGGMAEIYRATIGPDPGAYAFELALKRMHAHLEKDPNQVDMLKLVIRRKRNPTNGKPESRS